MYWNDLCDWTLWALVGLQMVDPSFRVVTNHKSPFNVLGGSTAIKWTNVPELWLHLTADSVSFSIKGPIEGSKHLQCQQSKERQVGSGGSKIHVSCQEGGWYLISGLGHKISFQTKSTMESLLKVKVARTRTWRFFIYSYSRLMLM